MPKTTMEPPVMIQADRVKKGKAQRLCPNCGEYKDIEADFGYRKMKKKGVVVLVRNQSWCKECR